MSELTSDASTWLWAVVLAFAVVVTLLVLFGSGPNRKE
jgi:disulfide bond formation protein DsbB